MKHLNILFQKRLKICNRAQEEIREVANQMFDAVFEVAPNLFLFSGAPCTFGRCPEGSMSCGHKQQPKEKQLQLIKRMEEETKKR